MSGDQARPVPAAPNRACPAPNGDSSWTVPWTEINVSHGAALNPSLIIAWLRLDHPGQRAPNLKASRELDLVTASPASRHLDRGDELTDSPVQSRRQRLPTAQPSRLTQHMRRGQSEVAGQLIHRRQPAGGVSDRSRPYHRGHVRDPDIERKFEQDSKALHADRPVAGPRPASPPVPPAPSRRRAGIGADDYCSSSWAATASRWSRASSTPCATSRPVAGALPQHQLPGRRLLTLTVGGRLRCGGHDDRAARRADPGQPAEAAANHLCDRAGRPCRGEATDRAGVGAEPRRAPPARRVGGQRPSPMPRRAT
jgi:hypothetical protein